jgi:hypothetical protein
MASAQRLVMDFGFPFNSNRFMPILAKLEAGCRAELGDIYAIRLLRQLKVGVSFD